jgi:glutaredoxin
MRYILFSTKNCPKCQEIKKLFESNNIEFIELDLTDPENIVHLRMNSVFGLTAPIVEDTEGYRFFYGDEGLTYFKNNIKN